MPFESEKQRRWMHANEPEMAQEWERKHEMAGNYKDYSNARNFPADTEDEMMVASRYPWVSPDPQDPQGGQFAQGAGEYGAGGGSKIQSGPACVDEDARVTTRHKDNDYASGVSASGGSVDGGTP